MKTKIFSVITALLSGAMFFSCANENVEPVRSFNGEESVLTTRAYGDKTPVVAAYIETNDTNPLNAGLYVMDNEPFIDNVILFAANIHANGNEPALYFNDKLQPVMDDVAQYIAPLQAQGVKVTLSLLGDHQGVGVSNLGTNNNAQKLAEICAYVVNEYGLDGMDVDDEWAKYGENSNFPGASAAQLSDFLVKLRAELGPDKLITLFEYGTYASNLTSAAMAAVDYAWYLYFGSNVYGSSSNGFANSKWSAQAINLNLSYSSYQQIQIQNRSSQSAAAGMGAIMTYDLRLHTQLDPLNALNRIARGAYGTSKSVTRSSNTGFARATAGPGLTITYADIQ